MKEVKLINGLLSLDDKKLWCPLINIEDGIGPIQCNNDCAWFDIADGCGKDANKQFVTCCCNAIGILRKD